MYLVWFCANGRVTRSCTPLTGYGCLDITKSFSCCMKKGVAVKKKEYRLVKYKLCIE